MHQIVTLANGVRIVTERVDGVRSAAIGIWVAVGSRHEAASESGSAHFIEHMVFKGTQTRTASEIAMEADAMGGQLNAYTAKESTCFYTRVLDTHVRHAADILCDMFFHARFDEDDIALERGVILEEIGMYEDTPEDLTAERLAAAVYRGSSLARPILGRASTLKGMTGAGLKAYMQKKYAPSCIVVALAGSFDDDAVQYLTERFSQMTPVAAPTCRPAAYHPAFTVRRRAIEQNHLTLAFPGLPYGDERRFTLQLLSFLLGGGMSSRLFQEVRERRGLCYTVYSYGAGHADTGLFGVYTALGRETETEAVTAICDTIRRFTDGGVTQQELTRAREQSKANVLMGLESTQARMSHLGRSALLSGEILTSAEIIAAYDAVTAEDVHALAQEIFDFSRASLSAVGRVATIEQYQQLLQ